MQWRRLLLYNRLQSTPCIEVRVSLRFQDFGHLLGRLVPDECEQVNQPECETGRCAVSNSGVRLY